MSTTWKQPSPSATNFALPRSGFQWLYILLHGDVGVFAALFGGTTIHSAARFNKSRINEQMKDMARWCSDTNYWQNLFFQGKWQLDKQLKRSRDGMIWLLSGDFNQLKLIYAEDDVIYSLWENTINSHISSSLITLPWNAPNACFACLPTESEMASRQQHVWKLIYNCGQRQGQASSCQLQRSNKRAQNAGNVQIFKFSTAGTIGAQTGVYRVLFRVRTLSGLYRMTPLDMECSLMSPRVSFVSRGDWRS